MDPNVKKWGSREFWGIGSDYDYDWLLNEKQKELRDKLIELCRTKIRPLAAHSDRTYEFPRASLDALSELGLLGLIVPKDLGGLGETHVCAAMIVETLARYGCASTALLYGMHLFAVSVLLFRHHKSPKIIDLLKRLDKEKLVGNLATSDNTTGGHVWYPLTSKSKMINGDTIQFVKHGSWVSGAGLLDWYIAQALSPDFGGDFSNLSNFLLFNDEVRGSTDDWSALGMHGNQSGPMIMEATLSLDRLVGPLGDVAKSNQEVLIPYFFLMTSSVWNGISLGCIDLAKKHVTRKAHADVGMRVCDYPSIQDYFGNGLSSTCVARSHIYLVAKELDSVTNNNDWSLHAEPNFMPRSKYNQWSWIAKLSSSTNVTQVTDMMLHACGGTGYKTELGLERLLRDGKAGHVMGVSNEYLRQLIGKRALFGIEEIDLWETKCNERVIHHELKKMSLSSKKELARKLLEEVQMEESGIQQAHPFQDSDFDNPFNTAPPTYFDKAFVDLEGKHHKPALSPGSWTSLKLLSKAGITKNMASFTFALPSEQDYTGCLPGQYVQVGVKIDDKYHYRYFSPVSPPDEFGKIEIVLKLETQGIMSNFFQHLKSGQNVEFKGPCGGFEYCPNSLDEVTMLASGAGVTPGLQLIRCLMKNKKDSTKMNLLYFSETVDDILYKDELDRYQSADSRLNIIYSLGETSEKWEGEEGFIDTTMIKRYISKPNQTMKHKLIMSGGLTMAVSCIHSLVSLGYPSEMIFIYGPFGTEMIRSAYGRNIKLSTHHCDF